MQDKNFKGFLLFFFYIYSRCIARNDVIRNINECNKIKKVLTRTIYIYKFKNTFPEKL